MKDMFLTVVSVKLEKRNSKLYIITLDNHRQFNVHEDLLIRYQIIKGQCLEPNKIDEIIEENEKYVAYLKGIRYLGPKPRTMQQMAEYLKRLDYTGSQVEYALERLTQEGFLNDKLYAEQYVQSKSKTTGKGKNRIKLELRQLGVSNSYIDQAISKLDDEKEYEAAYEAAQKKARGLKGEPIVFRQKLIQFLMRRGFSHEMIRKVVKIIENERKFDGYMDENSELLDN